MSVESPLREQSQKGDARDVAASAVPDFDPEILRFLRTLLRDEDEAREEITMLAGAPLERSPSSRGEAPVGDDVAGEHFRAADLTSLLGVELAARGGGRGSGTGVPRVDGRRVHTTCHGTCSAGSCPGTANRGTSEAGAHGRGSTLRRSSLPPAPVTSTPTAVNIPSPRGFYASDSHATLAGEGGASVQ
jgi:hypothetical protein